MATALSGRPAQDDLDRAVAALRGLRVVALTGAGVSTDSGIPDYRGPGSPMRTPMTYQQFVADADFRRRYWAGNHVGWRHLHSRRPNDAHYALADLEHRGVLTGVITQNVDRLHTLAGSRNVIDLHGTYATVVCLGCGQRTSRQSLARRLAQLNPGWGGEADAEIAPDADAVVASTATFRVADCARCGGMLKPEIVYFGENVPRARVDAAFAQVEAADALLVAGSSLTVLSGYRFVRHAARVAKPVVIVNRGPTRGDDLATVKLDAGCAPTLSWLRGELAGLNER
jgi:NAD-dependent SIR2 family protein deacetylase